MKILGMKLGLKETFTMANACTGGAVLAAFAVALNLNNGNLPIAALNGVVMTGNLICAAALREIDRKKPSLDNN